MQIQDTFTLIEKRKYENISAQEIHIEQPKAIIEC